jgi:hypothetical protein
MLVDPEHHQDELRDDAREQDAGGFALEAERRGTLA